MCSYFVHISLLHQHFLQRSLLHQRIFRMFIIYSHTLSNKTCPWIFRGQHNICLVFSIRGDIWTDSVSVQRSFFLPPAVVGIGSVSFGHLVQLVFLLDNVTLFVGGCHQFLGKFFVHVRASVFVVPALCDHPFHGKEATSVVCKRDGHLGGEYSQTY